MKKIILIVIALIAIFTGFSRASNYDHRLIDLHKHLSKQPINLHLMTERNGLKHAKKHFFGKNKPYSGTPRLSPYAHRNTAGILDMIAEPYKWQSCDASRLLPNGKLDQRIGLWNNDWKLFMLFGSVLNHPKGRMGGVLISAYVDRRGTNKIK